jgi:hypothetical protein
MSNYINGYGDVPSLIYGIAILLQMVYVPTYFKINGNNFLNLRAQSISDHEIFSTILIFWVGLFQIGSMTLQQFFPGIFRSQFAYLSYLNQFFCHTIFGRTFLEDADNFHRYEIKFLDECDNFSTPSDHTSSESNDSYKSMDNNRNTLTNSINFFGNKKVVSEKKKKKVKKLTKTECIICFEALGHEV